MQDHYQAIIQETLDHIRSNLSEQVSLDGIAKAMGYSKSRLGEIFKKGTGKGIVSQLIDLRIEKAKELLRHTNLNISEVASSVGFNSHTCFDIAFLKRVQISPTEFRKRTKPSNSTEEKASQEPGKSYQWFSDSMAKGLRKEVWLPGSGEWSEDQGCVLGTDEETFQLQFAKLLPENFQLHFEVQLQSAFGSPASSVAIALEDQAHGAECYSFMLGGDFNTMGTLFRKGVALSHNRKAIIAEGQWHKITITLKDDSLSLLQDGVEMFHFRDPFPAPYANRCRLVFFGWRSIMRLRNIEIEDLGFLPMMRSVRQGDALFNSGLYEQARQLYMRMQETETAPTDASELHYKIAMCFLGRQDFEQARIWAEKAALLPANVFWSQQASLALFEADRQEGLIEKYLAKFATLFEKAFFRDHLREKIQAANQDLLRRGFGETALVLASRLLALEEPGTFCYRQALAGVIEILHSLNRFEKALVCQRELTGLLRDLPHNRVFTLFTVVDTCNCLGQPIEARKALAEIRSISRNLANLARSDVYEAICLRVETRYDEALALLGTISAKYPRADGTRKFAAMVSSAILVSLGRTKEAKDSLSNAARLAPGWWYPNAGTRGEYEYPAWFAEGIFHKAAELLLDDSRYDDGSLSMRASQSVRVGIMYELAGDTKAAVEIWEETVRKYPVSHCAYYGGLAQFLLSKGPDCLDAMPFPVRARSEMFYLAGLLMEARGNTERSRSLLRHSAEEDLTNLWPAVLARKKLSGGLK